MMEKNEISLENQPMSRNARAVLQAVERLEGPCYPVDNNVLCQCLQNRLDDHERDILLDSIRSLAIEGKGKLMLMLFTFLKQFTMTDTINLLAEIGQGRLASKLKLEYFGYNLRITGGCTRDLTKIRKFWSTIKIQSDTNSFKDASAFYNSIAEQCRREMETTERKQYVVDKLAIITWFQVQQYEADGCKERRHLLANMRASIPEGVDRSLTEIVYHSKMATTLEFEDKIEEAFDMGSKAKYLSYVFNDDSAKVMAHYSYFFFHRKLYLRNKTECNRQKAMQQCNIGCDMFLDADDEFEKFCYLLFLLYKAGEYLQITYDYEVLDTYPIGREAVKATKEVLDTASKFLDNADPRRELAFHLCNGRFHQIQGNYTTSAEHLRIATKLMKNVTLNHTEQGHIKSFCRRVADDQIS